MLQPLRFVDLLALDVRFQASWSGARGGRCSTFRLAHRRCGAVSDCCRPKRGLGGAAKRLFGAGSIRDTMPEWLLARVVTALQAKRPTVVATLHLGHSSMSCGSGRRTSYHDLPETRSEPFDVREALLRNIPCRPQAAGSMRRSRRTRSSSASTAGQGYAQYAMSRPPPFPPTGLVMTPILRSQDRLTEV